MSKPLRAVVYARVSTLLGQDPENQLVPIREYVKHRGFELVGEYVDHGISGTRERRPALDRLAVDVKNRKCDIVVVAALDRLGRSTKHMLTLLEEWNHVGVSLVSLREGIAFDTPTEKMIFSVLTSVAALERAIISERIKISLATKKLAAQKAGSDWRCGPKAKVTDELTARVTALRARGLSIRQIERELSKSVSKTSIFRMLHTRKK